MSEIKPIHIANLSIDPNQSRSSKNPRVDEEFKQSIEKHGILNPLTVRPREEKRDRDTNKPKNAGEEEYYIVAGRRRYHAAVQLGIEKIDCIVKDLSKEEAIGASFDENEQRVSLSQLELAKSVKKRYDILEEDLVGEDETVECPECGKECNGRQGLKTHIQMKHEGCDESSDPFTSERQIFEQIAESSSFDWRTVQRLINVASIPEQFQAFVKIPEERTPQEEELVSDKISEGFTFANTDKNSTVSQKSIDFARFVNSGDDENQNTPAELVEKTLSNRNFYRKNTNETGNIFSDVLSLWQEWKEVDEEDMSSGAVYLKCVNGTKPKKGNDEEESENKDNSEADSDDNSSSTSDDSDETSSDSDDSDKQVNNEGESDDDSQESQNDDVEDNQKESEDETDENDSDDESEDSSSDDSENNEDKSDEEVTSDNQTQYSYNVSLGDANENDSFKDELSDDEVEKRVEKAVEILKQGVDG